MLCPLLLAVFTATVMVNLIITLLSSDPAYVDSSFE